MAGNDQSASVNVDINVPDHGAKDSIRSVADAFRSLLGVSKDAADGHKAVGAAAKEAAGAHNSLGEAMKGVTSYSRTIAIGLEQVGLQAGAGAARVDALVEVLNGMRGAVPALLAVGAAIGGVALIAGTLKEAIDEAAASQRELASIGALVKNAGGGGDYRAQTQQINEMTAALSRNGTFAKTEYLAGVQAMITAGISVNDTMRSQAAATDLAAAKNISLISAEEELSAAYNGRFRGLQRLGIITREEMKNGIDYETILQRLSSRLGGTDAAVLDTYSGKVQNLGNIVGLLKEQFGEALLPVVETFIDALRSTATAMQPVADQFSIWVHTHLPELKAGAEGFASIITAVATRALPALEKATEAGLNWLSRLGAQFRSDKSPIDQFVESIKNTKQAIEDATSGVREFNKELQPIADVLNLIKAASDDAGKALHDFFGASYQKESDARNDQLTKTHELLAGIAHAAEFARGVLDRMHGGTGASGGGGTGSNVAPVVSKSLEDAYAIAQQRTGVSADVIRAIAQQESAQGKSSNFNPKTGHDYDGNAGVGIGQLDPTSGASPAELALVATDPVAAATKIGEMVGKNMHLGLRSALAIYNSGGTKDAAGYADQVLARIPAQTGPTNAAAAMRGPGKPGDAAPGELGGEKSAHHIAGTGSGSQNDFQPQLIADYRTKVDEVRAAQVALTAELYNTTVSEDSFKQAVLSATTAEAKLSAERALHVKITHDAEASVKILNSAIAENGKETTRLAAEQVAAKKATDDSMNAYNALAKAHTGEVKVASEVKSSLTALRKEFDEHKKTLDEVSRKIIENDANTNTNVASLNKATAATHDAANANAALALAYNAQMAALEESNNVEQGTLGKSLADQIDYWTHRLSLVTFGTAEEARLRAQLNAAILNEARQHAADMQAESDRQAQMGIYGVRNTAADPFAALEARRAMLAQQEAAARSKGESAAADAYKKQVQAADDDLHKARIDAQNAFLQTWQDRESAWMDGIITHTKSLRDTLKDVWKTILSDYIHTLTQMAAQKLFGGINGALGGILGGGQGGQAMPGGGILSFLGGGGGGSGPTLGAPSGATPVYVVGAAASYLQATTGSPNGVSGIIGGPGGSSTAAGAAGAAAGLSFLQRQIAAGGQAMAIGGLVTGMTGGNAANGAIGSLAGSALGSMFGKMIGAGFGPAGMLIGSALGGLVGGMFGPSRDPSKTPDIHDPLYAQMVTNLNGASGSFNGQTISPDNKYNASMGGTSLAGVMSNFVASHASDQKDLTPAQQALYTQILGLMGGNAKAGESSLHVASEKDGTIHLASGTSISVAQLEQIYGNFQNQAGAINSNVPVWSVQRGMPDYNLSTGKQNGTFTPGAPGNGATGSGTTFPGQPVQPPVKIDASNAIFVGAAGIDELTKMITAAMARGNRGTVPGTGATGVRFATQTAQ